MHVPRRIETRAAPRGSGGRMHRELPLRRLERFRSNCGHARCSRAGHTRTVPPSPDRLRDVVDVVLEALDEGLDGRALAARAMLSPFHFNRLVRAGVGEAPATFR